MRIFGVLRKLKNAWILSLTTVCPTSTRKQEKSNRYPGVAQLGARVVWDHQAAGSIPVTRTKFADSSAYESRKVGILCGFLANTGGAIWELGV